MNGRCMLNGDAEARRRRHISINAEMLVRGAGNEGSRCVRVDETSACVCACGSSTHRVQSLGHQWSYLVISHQVRVVVDSEGSRRDCAPRVSGLSRFGWERKLVRNFIFGCRKVAILSEKITERTRRDILSD